MWLLSNPFAVLVVLLISLAAGVSYFTHIPVPFLDHLHPLADALFSLLASLAKKKRKQKVA